MDKQFTNALTPEILSSLDKSPFTAAELAEMSEEARALIDEQIVFCQQHPVTAIYRIAVAGSLTHRGGVADEFSTDPNDGFKIARDNDNGPLASVLMEGCTVSYPDGTTARIVSSAGSANTFDGRGIALVGSVLDNGDEIISTPQSLGLLVDRAGVAMPEDFLRVSGGE
jgi:hypothetical protein